MKSLKTHSRFKAGSKEVGRTNFVGNILSTNFCALIEGTTEFVENKLGLSCAKLRSSWS
jgi:hypothetical protein